jgi:hypothetical protein
MAGKVEVELTSREQQAVRSIKSLDRSVAALRADLAKATKESRKLEGATRNAGNKGRDVFQGMLGPVAGVAGAIAATRAALSLLNEEFDESVRRQSRAKQAGDSFAPAVGRLLQNKPASVSNLRAESLTQEIALNSGEKLNITADALAEAFSRSQGAPTHIPVDAVRLGTELGVLLGTDSKELSAGLLPGLLATGGKYTPEQVLGAQLQAGALANVSSINAIQKIFGVGLQSAAGQGFSSEVGLEVPAILSGALQDTTGLKTDTATRQLLSSIKTKELIPSVVKDRKGNDKLSFSRFDEGTDFFRRLEILRESVQGIEDRNLRLAAEERIKEKVGGDVGLKDFVGRVLTGDQAELDRIRLIRKGIPGIGPESAKFTEDLKAGALEVTGARNRLDVAKARVTGQVNLLNDPVAARSASIREIFKSHRDSFPTSAFGRRIDEYFERGDLTDAGLQAFLSREKKRFGSERITKTTSGEGRFEFQVPNPDFDPQAANLIAQQQLELQKSQAEAANQQTRILAEMLQVLNFGNLPQKDARDIARMIITDPASENP